MPRYKSSKRNAEGVRDGFDSDLERAVSYANGSIPHNKVRVSYVTDPRRYTPDFILRIDDDKAVLVEVKGLLTSDERTKYVQVKKNYQYLAQQLGVKEVELVFIFQNASNKVNPKVKNSKKYGEWATVNGFRWTDEPFIPDDWFEY